MSFGNQRSKKKSDQQRCCMEELVSPMPSWSKCQTVFSLRTSVFCGLAFFAAIVVFNSNFMWLTGLTNDSLKVYWAYLARQRRYVLKHGTAVQKIHNHIIAVPWPCDASLNVWWVLSIWWNIWNCVHPFYITAPISHWTQIRYWFIKITVSTRHFGSIRFFGSIGSQKWLVAI